MINGDRELAIKNYKKSLELNPKNDNAANAIKRLENQMP
jgi:predicted TPR repeat methyltransferase